MITQTLFVSLLQNTAILISAVLLYDYLWVQGEVMRKWYGKFMAGVLIALIGYLLMLTPWIIQPGLFFDLGLSCWLSLVFDWSHTYPYCHGTVVCLAIGYGGLGNIWALLLLFLRV